MQFNLLPKSPEQPAQRSYVYDKNAYCTKRKIVKIVWCSNLFSPLFGYCDRLYYLCNQLITLQKQNNLLTPTHNESQLSINPVTDTLLSSPRLCAGDSLHRLDAEQSLSARWRIGTSHRRAQYPDDARLAKPWPRSTNGHHHLPSQGNRALSCRGFEGLDLQPPADAGLLAGQVLDAFPQRPVGRTHPFEYHLDAKFRGRLQLDRSRNPFPRIHFARRHPRRHPQGL